MRSHEQSTHMEIRVEIPVIPKQRPSMIACTQCEYTCKLQIQLKQHLKNKHKEPENMKYKCNMCSFQAQRVVQVYDHKFTVHPETPMEYNPNKPTVKDMVLNLIAEQNIEIVEELQDIKKYMRDAFERLSDEIRDSFEDTAKSAFQKINEKMSKLEKIQEIISKKDSKPQTKGPHPTPCPSVPLPTPSSSNLSRVATKASSKSRSINRKKTAYLQKPKILYVGDSIAQNADIALVERVTHSRIRTKKAYSSINDTRARWPHKNLTDVTPAALLNTYEEDKFTHLVLAAPTVDISNMNTEKLTKSDNI